MSTKLYVGNLAFQTTSQELQELFAQAGTVESASVVEDRDTGRSRGFAFVEMSTKEEAASAIEQFNGKEVGGRALKVNEAKPRENRGGGGGRGGFGGNRGGGGGYGGGPQRRRRQSWWWRRLRRQSRTALVIALSNLWSFSRGRIVAHGGIQGRSALKEQSRRVRFVATKKGIYEFFSTGTCACATERLRVSRI
jgi:RNA recognition motif-containing protein